MTIVLLTSITENHNLLAQESNPCCTNESNFLSPLQQFKEGINSENIVCPNGFILVQKAEDGTPACLRPDDTTKLIDRGWAKIITRIDIVNVGPTCDFDCKNNRERSGAICLSNPDGSYTCSNISEQTIREIIPWSYKDVTNRNLIPLNITLSLEINNTIGWTNTDNNTHEIVGNDGSFDSDIILPNQTWIHVFDKVGVYKYHDPSYSWMQGTIYVKPLDANFKTGQPIFHDVIGGPVDNLLFRETDHMGYIKKISILDNKTVLVTLGNDNGNNTSILTNKTISIGDRLIGSCQPMAFHLQLSYLTLEKIVVRSTPFAEFRENFVPYPETQCSFENLMSMIDIRNLA